MIRDKTDLKGMYQEKAQELAERDYGEEIDFYDLPNSIQSKLYGEAEILVHEGLQDQADMMRKELAVELLSHPKSVSRKHLLTGRNE